MSSASVLAGFAILAILALFATIAYRTIQADHTLSQIEDNFIDLSDYPLYKD